MRTPRARSLALALALALWTAFLPAAPAGAAAEQGGDLIPVGEPAPAFEAVDIEGKPFTLQGALEQGPVLLAFWSIFCGTCRDELPILETEQPKYAGKVQFVTVNLDEAPRAKTVRGFAAQQGFTFRILLNKIEGKEFQIDQAFRIKATPALYLVGRDGKVLYAHYGALGPQELAEVLAKVP